jgi:predicted transcriptional regulator
MLCERLTKFSIPAVRAAVSDALYYDYKMPQAGIAEKLGVAQPAVYKYLKKRYSGNVSMVVDFLKSKNIYKQIVKEAVSGASSARIQEMVERLASSNELYSYCSSLLANKK